MTEVHISLFSKQLLFQLAIDEAHRAGWELPEQELKAGRTRNIIILKWQPAPVLHT